jgi:hypothetical protein
MAFSYVRYTANGSTTNYTFAFPAIDPEHIKVRVNGVLTTLFTFLNSSTIKMNVAPAAGVILDIRRETPKEQVIVDFTDGSVLLERDLDLLGTYSLYLAQETEDALDDSITQDYLGVFQGQSKRIANVATPVENNDAVNKSYADAVITQAAGSATSALASQVAAETSATDSAASAVDSEASAVRAEANSENVTAVANNAANINAAVANEANINAAVDSAATAVTKADESAASAAKSLGYLQAYRATSYGALASDPTIDPNGGAPTIGDEYFNTTANLIKRFNGTTWQASDISTANLAAPGGAELVGFGGSALVSDLRESGGSSLVGYMPAGTGAVARTAQDKMLESVSVRDFGAASAADPTATTTALAAAISFVTALGGGDVIFPPGDFRINGILTLPGKVRLVGQGAGRVDQPVQVAATTLSWYGGATEMVRVGYQGATVVNGGIEGIRLDGRALATRGLSMKDIQHATVNEIVITGTTVSALYMTNTPAYAPTGFCVFKKIQISLRGGATNNAHGILLDGGGSGVDGVTLCSWSDIRVEHANGDGVRVNERGDGMTWYNYYSFRAGVETGFGIRAAGSSSGVIGSWALYNALPNGGIQIDSPGSALGWKFDTLNDIDMDPSAIDMIYGNGAFDVSVQTSISTRQLGPAKIRGFRNSIIEDGMHFRRWDSGNNSLITNKGNYLTGGAYAGSNITSASQPGGAVSFSTGNVATNALYFSACGLANSGYASVYIPQMAVTWTPTSTTLFVARAGFVGSFADLPSDGIYVEAAPGTSGAYRCVTRLGGVETATVTPVGLGIAVVQWRIEYKPGVALFFYRTPGNNQWGLGAAHTTNIPTVLLTDVVYIRTLEASGKGLSIYDYKIAWNLEQ